MHAPAQPVHLVEQVKNDRDAFVVHAKIVAKIANELGAGEVQFREGTLTMLLRRDQPAGADPGLERLLIETGTNQEFSY
jgi:hypothetical protein